LLRVGVVVLPSDLVVIPVVTTNTSPGLRERKKMQLREQMRTTALREFARRGYEDVTIDEIAAAANVSPRTFYRYFPSKDHVLLDHWEAQIQMVVEALRARPADESPGRALQEAFLAKAALADQDAETYRDWLRILHSAPSVVEAFEVRGIVPIVDLVADRMGLPHDDVRPAALIAATTAAVREANIDWLMSRGHDSLHDVTRRAMAVLPGPPAPTACDPGELATAPPAGC
jgi:AcrR family transcriptional regulator